jgi:hypothetical protein
VVEAVERSRHAADWAVLDLEDEPEEKKTAGFEGIPEPFST